MATYYARKTGNINATDVWATTPTGTAGDFYPSFTSADVLVTNSFTVTVNVSTTVAEVRADTTGGATAGGNLLFSGTGITLTANINGVGSTANGLVQTGTGANNITIVGNVTAGSTVCVRWQASGGTLNIVGSITGGSAAVNAVSFEGSANTGGTINITGNVTGGTVTNANGVGTASAGCTFNITGDVTGGSGGVGVLLSNPASATITGNVTGAAAAGVTISGAVNATIAGTATGGLAAGFATSGSSAACRVQVTRAKGGPLTGSAVGVANPTGAIAVVIVDELEWGDTGCSPVSGPVFMSDKPTNAAVLYRAGLSKATLADISSLLPAASDVRSGTSYASGLRTGTMAVPPAASVARGVAVDATTGTAFLSAADLWDYMTENATTAGSMGERLANAATVASTGQQLSNAMTP